jgi:hypothetical protein
MESQVWVSRWLVAVALREDSTLVAVAVAARFCFAMHFQFLPTNHSPWELVLAAKKMQLTTVQGEMAQQVGLEISAQQVAVAAVAAATGLMQTCNRQDQMVDLVEEIRHGPRGVEQGQKL